MLVIRPFPVLLMSALTFAVGSEAMAQPAPSTNPAEATTPATKRSVWRNPAQANPQSDPLAGVNQVGYQFNRGFNVVVEQPVTKAYRKVVPQPVRKSVKNFVSNFTTPGSILNQVAQGKTDQAGRETARYITNSTLGVLGIFDVATSHFDMPAQPREDFGQTLGNYGVPAGPPVEFPILGVTNPRDLVGFVADIIVDPFVTPGATISGVSPTVAITGQVSRLDERGPKAAFPEPTDGKTTYELRRIQAVERRNAAIQR